VERNGLVKIWLGGMPIQVREEEVKVARGEGLSGVSVHCLRLVPCVNRPGTYYVADIGDNALRATADEVFALLKMMAPDYEITAVKKT
jgi:hypothetical protein